MGRRTEHACPGGAGLLLAVAATVALLTLRPPWVQVAAAPHRHPTPAPAPTPTPTARPSTAEPQTHDDALRAAAGLARATATLVALGGFGHDPGSPIAIATQAAAPAPGSTAAQLIDGLETAEAGELALAAALAGDGVQLDPDVVEALTPLSASDLAAAAAGDGISVPAETDLRALSSLLYDEGWSPSGPTPPPDPAGIAAALPAALGLAAATPSPSPAAATPAAEPAATPAAAAQGRGSTAGAYPPATADALRSAAPWIAGALTGLVALIVQALRRGRRTSVATPPLQEVLEISRRLDTEDTAASIDRAAIREVTRVIPARAAAVVTRRDGRWLVAEETRPGLVRAERLGDGIIGRVADTGQLAVTLSTTEPSLSRRPVALAVIPLAAGGVVASVLVLVRPATQPFTDGERDLMLAAAPAVAAAMERARRARAALRESLRDPLTGAGNRRGFDGALARALEEGRGQASLIMVDLDHFKRVNDTHGHPAGDGLLRGVVEVMRHTAGADDCVYRYGGEEFCLLLPDTSLADARLVAERVRRGVEAHDFLVGGGVHLRATASLGVAATNGDGRQGLVARADAALYNAKTSGRNRVCAG